VAAVVLLRETAVDVERVVAIDVDVAVTEEVAMEDVTVDRFTVEEVVGDDEPITEMVKFHVLPDPITRLPDCKFLVSQTNETMLSVNF
jgi:hypothetical protein